LIALICGGLGPKARKYLRNASNRASNARPHRPAVGSALKGLPPRPRSPTQRAALGPWRALDRRRLSPARPHPSFNDRTYLIGVEQTARLHQPFGAFKRGAIYQYRLTGGRRCFSSRWHWQRGTRRLLGESGRRCCRWDRCCIWLPWGLRRDRRCVWLPRGFRADEPRDAFSGRTVRRRRLRKRRNLFANIL
jgi:hypothetical protein